MKLVLIGDEGATIEVLSWSVTRRAMKKGERFLVRNTTVGSEDVAEGIVTLVGRPQGKHATRPEEWPGGCERWDVEFDDEPGETYRRWVRLEDQIEKEGAR